MTKSERLIYLPLGGAGEIGMNAYVYGYGAPGEERLIVVDLGVTFPNMDETPGVDLILADMAWLEARRDQIDGIFVTHAHEDHIGGIALCWDRLGAPIYTRAFTGHHVRRKMAEWGHPEAAVHTTSAWPATTAAGPFTVGFAPISHSIPESSALIIDTPESRIVHTGDFKRDPTPVIGEGFDEQFWAEIGQSGVKVLVCDSTNVFSEAAGRSEASLAEPVEAFMREANGMVVATTFASNVARLVTLARAAEKAGRSICLLGRAMRRMVEAGALTGVLPDFPKTISPEDAVQMPRDNLFLLATGSQGERRAATAQLAQGKYLGLSLQEGDTFLFSSKTIPGNERGVIRIMNQLSVKGVEVVDDHGGLYHVSGHANRPDLQEMHRLIAPEMLIPMHGEHRHLREHARLGEAAGIASIIAPNGTMLDLGGDKPKVAEHVETGRIYLDGRVQFGALDGIIRDRIRMALGGHVSVSLILDENDDPLGDPWCDVMGLPDMGEGPEPLAEVLEAELSQYLMRAGGKTLADDDKLEGELRKIVRRAAQAEIGKKPEVTVTISRLS